MEAQSGFMVNEGTNLITRTPDFAHIPLPDQISRANGIVNLPLLSERGPGLSPSDRELPCNNYAHAYNFDIRAYRD